MQQVYRKELLIVLKKCMEKKIDEYLEKAKNSISAYCTPLIKPSKYPFKNIEMASGTFVSIGSRRGILTNAHVEEMFDSINLFLVPHVMNKYLVFSSVIKGYAAEDPALVGPDLAFVELDDKSCNIVINDLKKQFGEFNPDIDYKNKNCIWMIWGNVYEGKDSKRPKNIIYFPNAGPYIVVPDLDNIGSETHKLRTNDVSIDLIECRIETIKKVPSKFDGMSGAALWQIIFNEDSSIQNIFLAGIASRYAPSGKAEKLVCIGPKALYEFFYVARRSYALHQR